MIKLIEKIKKEGDSIGSIIEIVIENPPAGLGKPVFDKLDADLAKAFMSIGAVKGVEIGAGFRVAEMKGSENNDQMRINSKKEIEFLSNNAGGILGGISTGNTIVARLAIKPPPSIKKLQKTITSKGENTEISIEGRHDTCLAPRIIPVAESMAAITLLKHL
jgi:chorismate synthase